ncbi:type II toxin-antitoxin system RelB/DinJ family antitoxin [Levilactobacillus lindianensis]|uniref:type II toxin-antitoxin system RelB/DinJ family antitoxin n=1 Tax=Levilactobacillus lindianensis TaxID=2486018 RepID=UPI0013DE022B|nr:type II toxin-antitoxin system RelB/DinJ family antitoxin [Levilactobacillus lindianensis]
MSLTPTVDAKVKARASEVAASNGLNLTDVITLFLQEVCQTGKLPFTSSTTDFPDIWNDDPQAIATFNKKLGIANDHHDFGIEQP